MCQAEVMANVEKLGNLTCDSEFSDLLNLLDLAPLSPHPMEQRTGAEGQPPSQDQVRVLWLPGIPPTPTCVTPCLLCSFTQLVTPNM